MSEKQQYTLERFSPYLFWDMDKEQIDLDVSSTQIIQRVMEYGGMEDWRLLKSYYGLKRIVQSCQQLRSLDPRVVAFLCCISHVTKESFRCYHNTQSPHPHWSY